MKGWRHAGGLLVAIGLALLPQGASAWSCVPESLAQQAASADTIFVGVLTATGSRETRERDIPGWFPRWMPPWVPRPTIEGKVRYLYGTGTFKVATRYRGTLKRDVTLDIGPEFPNSNGVGQTFVVLANTYDGVMMTGPCSGTFQGSRLPPELSLRPQFPVANDVGAHPTGGSGGPLGLRAAGVAALVVLVAAGGGLLLSRRTTRLPQT